MALCVCGSISSMSIFSHLFVMVYWFCDGHWFTASLDIMIMHLNKTALFGFYFNGVMDTLYSYLQWTELQWQFTHNTLVFRLFGYTGTTTDSAFVLIKPSTVQDGMEGNHPDKLG